MLFDKFENRIVYKGVLEAVTPIHIGAGENSIDPGKTDGSVVKNSEGKPYIPGSSLKGVLRCKLESLLSNEEIAKKWGVWSCNIFGNTCITKSFVENNKDKRKNNPEEYAREIWNKSCHVCRLFGNQHMASHVQVKDSVLLTGGEEELRNGVGIDRDTGTAAKGITYDFNVVSAGSTFEFELVACNIDEDSKKLLNLLISMLEQGEISIGGKTSRGLGKIVLKNLEISVQTPETLLEQFTKA
ncbi:MAG: CRISPR-associated RAMP protein [Clostridiaceae bacterium]|nr:CRISPR-associated RAMP protein [Clostridiaceae bacterium]